MKKQAKTGGEVGANGEWYQGGQFIATSPTRAKGSFAAQGDATLAAKIQTEQNARERDYLSWQKPRQAALAGLILELNRSTSSFLRDMGNQLQCHSNLSPKCAAIVASKYPEFTAAYLAALSPNESRQPLGN